MPMAWQDLGKDRNVVVTSPWLVDPFRAGRLAIAP